MKFLAWITTGLSCLVLGVLALALGILQSSQVWMVGGLLMGWGVVAVLIAARFYSADLLPALLWAAYKRGNWDNSLCPICGRWMKTKIITNLGNAQTSARIWYCTNLAHDLTWPGGDIPVVGAS